MVRFSCLIALYLGIFPWSGVCSRARADDRDPIPPIPALKPALQKLVDDGKIPGGVALVARRGAVVDVTAFGWREQATKTPMTEDTIFAIASMTKPITCVAAMTLIEEGKLAIDDPLEKYLTEFRELRVLGDPRDDSESGIATVLAKRPVTVRHLLTHTSGFSYGVFDSTDPRLKTIYSEAGVVGHPHKTLAELVARIAHVPLAHQPGEGWTYGFSHDVLARLIEVVSGQNLSQYLQERIFTPLKMHDTFFHVPEEKRSRVATIYDAGEDGRLTALPKEYGSETLFQGGGGLFSTARDYGRFARMLLENGSLDGRRVIQPATVDAMTTNQIGELWAYSNRKYGLGFGLALAPPVNGDSPRVERYFAGGAYSTNTYVLPHRDRVLILMTQITPTNHGGADQVFYRVVNETLIMGKDE